MKLIIHVIFRVIKIKVDLHFEYLLHYILWSSTRGVSFLHFSMNFMKVQGSLYRIFFYIVAF